MKQGSAAFRFVCMFACVLTNGLIAFRATSAGAQACPIICGTSCQLDANDIPVHCSNGQCACPPGYDTEAGPLCQPHQPELGSQSHVGGCSGSCTSMPWGSAQGPWTPFDIVAVHGTSPGGEAFMPVWGAQASSPCGVHGVRVLPDANGNPIRSWGGCEPNPCGFCSGPQDASYDGGRCATHDICGDGGGEEECGFNEQLDCLSDFTSARPYLDQAHVGVFNGGFADPTRIDFVNNVIVYRAPILWENHSDEGLDDDYTLDLHSSGHELEDQGGGQRLHVEFDSDETIDHFIPNFDSDKCFTCSGGSNGGGNCDLSEGNDDCPGGGTCSTTPNPPAGDSFGAANLWWRKLRCLVDQSPGDDDQTDRDIRCFMESLVDPTLSCPLPDGVEPNGTGPMAVVVGVPGLDCADHPKGDTVEIHPAYAVAIRIQEYPKPEQWAFFYRDSGDNGECGDSTYRRCGTTFQLPLALPFVPAGKVLTSADVHVDASPWAVDDTSPADVTVDSHFDRANGTVLSITLPGKTDDFFGFSVPVGEGVVGLVTVTPVFDTTPPTTTCPPDEVVSATSPSGATVTYPAPVVSDNCSVVSTDCTPASGSLLPIGTTTVTCVAVDDSSNTSSCPFTIHVKGAAEQITDLIALVGSFHLEPGSQDSLLAKLTQALKDLADGKVGVVCNELRAFINEVNAQKKAQNRQLGQNPAEADQLIAAATQIRAVLGCGP